MPISQSSICGNMSTKEQTRCPSDDTSAAHFRRPSASTIRSSTLSSSGGNACTPHQDFINPGCPALRLTGHTYNAVACYRLYQSPFSTLPLNATSTPPILGLNLSSQGSTAERANCRKCVGDSVTHTRWSCCRRATTLRQGSFTRSKVNFG